MPSEDRIRNERFAAASQIAIDVVARLPRYFLFFSFHNDAEKRCFDCRARFVIALCGAKPRHLPARQRTHALLCAILLRYLMRRARQRSAELRHASTQVKAAVDPCRVKR